MHLPFIIVTGVHPEDDPTDEFKETKLGTGEVVERFRLEVVSEDDFKVIDVERECKLKEHSEEMKYKFTVPIVSSFYEFESELETLSKQKRIIFMRGIIELIDVYNGRFYAPLLVVCS